MLSVGAFLRRSLIRISSRRFFNRPSDGASITFLSCALIFLLSLSWRAASRNTAERVKYEEMPMFHNPHESQRYVLLIGKQHKTLT